jgi:hypothetical protein
VTNKGQHGFDVVELSGGISNVSFSWSLVASRIDETKVGPDGSTKTSAYSQARFPNAPDRVEKEQLKQDKQVSE